MAITKYSDISSFVATIYERSLFVMREMNLMAGLVSNYSAQGWMARMFSTRPQVTPESVADGVDYSNPTTFGKSSVGTLTPGEIIAQILLTDQNVETDPDGARNDAATELGMAVASKIDTDLCSVFDLFTTDKGDGAGNSATISNLAAGVAVVRYNMKVAGPIHVVFHPYHWHDIWVEIGQPAATYANLADLTSQAMRDYYVGSLLGVKIFTSSNVKDVGGDDFVSGIFNPASIALDTRRPYRLEPERDASLRAWELNATGGYAYGLGARPTFGVGFTADAAEPS